MKDHPVEVLPGIESTLALLNNTGSRITCYGGRNKEYSFDKHLKPYENYFDKNIPYIDINAFRPGMYEIIKEIFGLDFDEVVFIDDINRVAEVCKSLGAGFIGVPASMPHNYQREEMVATGVRYMVNKSPILMKNSYMRPTIICFLQIIGNDIRCSMEKRNCLMINYIIPIICGFTAANMYYVQPLAPIISSELMIPYVKASMLYSFSLIGNALSLFFIIPLGDFYNKKLLITLLYTVSMIALLIFSITKIYYILSATALLIGIGTSAIPLITAGLSKQNDGTQIIGR